MTASLYPAMMAPALLRAPIPRISAIVFDPACTACGAPFDDQRFWYCTSCVSRRAVQPAADTAAATAAAATASAAAAAAAALALPPAAPAPSVDLDSYAAARSAHCRWTAHASHLPLQYWLTWHPYAGTSPSACPSPSCDEAASALPDLAGAHAEPSLADLPGQYRCRRCPPHPRRLLCAVARAARWHGSVGHSWTSSLSHLRCLLRCAPLAVEMCLLHCL